MSQQFSFDDVRIAQAPPTQIAILQHRGDPAQIGETIQRFVAWRKSMGLGKQAATFNIFRCDPHATPPDEFRLDMCVSVSRDRLFPMSRVRRAVDGDSWGTVCCSFALWA